MRSIFGAHWKQVQVCTLMIDVKRVILDESGNASEVRLEDEFFSALKENQRGMWMREIQGVGKEKGEY